MQYAQSHWCRIGRADSSDHAFDLEHILNSSDLPEASVNAARINKSQATSWLAIAALGVALIAAVLTIALTAALAAKVDVLASKLDGIIESSALPDASETDPDSGASSTPPPEDLTEGEANGVSLGSPFETDSAALTINSVEVLDQIETVDGAPLSADEGTKLVLVKASYTVVGPNAADLSCGDTGLYIRGYDSAGSEMPQVFETHRIPGNMGCNEKLMTGQTHDWNIAFKIVGTNAPDHLLIIDSGINDFDTETKVLLR